MRWEGEVQETLEDSENNAATLRRLLEEGEKSGRADYYSYEALMSELDEELGCS